MQHVQTRPISFAVIGCGSITRGQHLPNLLRSPKAAVHVCVDVNPAALRYCREHFGVERTTDDYLAAIMDPDVDAICLAASANLRLPAIEAAAKAGKAVYVEKPLANSLEEIYRIQEVVEQAGIAVCVGHNRRCSPAMIDAHAIFENHMLNPRPCSWRWDQDGAAAQNRLADEGVPGMSVRINDDWHSWKCWALDAAENPHGPMLSEMTHYTDICNWFINDQPHEVMAMESGPLHRSVIIRYRGGAMATINMCANGSFGYPKELYEVMGHGGVVAIDNMVEVRTAGIHAAPARRTYPMVNDRHLHVGAEGGISGWMAKKRAACEEAAAKGDPLLQFTAEPDKGHAHAINRFVDQITGEGEEVCGVNTAVAASRIAFAAIKSVAEHRPVLLEEI